MTKNSSVRGANSVLVVSCSDARLTAEDAAQSWRNRLGFDGDIFEVRCPGGGLALADKEGTFYKSALESFKLLSRSRNFSIIILAFHEDCAYFRDKSGFSAHRANDEQRKWRLIEQAARNITGWADDLIIRPIYLTFEAGDHIGHDHPSSLDPFPFQELRRREEAPSKDSIALCSVGAQHPPLRPMAAGATSTPMTLRGFNKIVEEELISGSGSLEDAIVRLEDQAFNFGGMPPWRIERQAREFLDLLLSSGRKDTQEIRHLLRSFVRAYAGQQVPPSVLRGIMNELNDLIDASSTPLAAQRT